jgi:hypothetical protein
MDFADDRVAADADFGGDLAARQSGDDEVAELLDTLHSPGRAGHDHGLVVAAAIWAADRTKAAQRRPQALARSFSARNRCAAARFHASRRITEPHPRFPSDASPLVFSRRPYA